MTIRGHCLNEEHRGTAIRKLAQQCHCRGCHLTAAVDERAFEMCPCRLAACVGQDAESGDPSPAMNVASVVP